MNNHNFVNFRSPTPYAVIQDGRCLNWNMGYTLTGHIGYTARSAF